MRTARMIVVGLLAAASTLILTPPAAQAAAPTAPYDALTADGQYSNWSFTDDPSNAQFSLQAVATTGLEFRSQALPLPTSRDMHAYLLPPTGGSLAVGTYATKVFAADASHAQFQLYESGKSLSGNCTTTSTGSITILELTRSAGAVTAFAATYNQPCSGTRGEIRWHSSLGYKAVATSPVEANGTLNLGTVEIGQSVQGTETMTATGSDPVTVGSVVLLPFFANSQVDDFSIVADTCSGSVLAYGESCTVTIAVHPMAMVDTFTALVSIPTDGAAIDTVFAVGANFVDPRRVQFSPGYLDLGSTEIGKTSAPQTVTVTSSGSASITFGTADVSGYNAEMTSGFAITADTCSGHTLAPGTNCTVTVVAKPASPISYSAALELPDNSFLSPKRLPLSAYGMLGTPPAAYTYHPVVPARVLDTRTGNGAAKAPIGPGGVVHLQLAGRGGLPNTGLVAVVLNVTVTGPTAAGYLTLFPTNTPRPTASNLNFQKGWLRSNSVTVRVGDNGQVDLYNASGSTQVIVDVTGFYAGDATSAGAGGQYQPVNPERLVDTRTLGHGPMPAGQQLKLAVDFGAANPHIRAFAVNITAVAPNTAGYLTAWNGVDARPGTSTVNYSAHEVVPNLAIIPAAPCQNCGTLSGQPSFAVYSSATTHFLVDLVGVYDDGQLSGGLRFLPLQPTRIVDSRTSLGTAAIGQGQTAHITAPRAVTGYYAQGIVANVTAVAPTASTYLTVWPAGYGRPTVSNLNPTAGQIVPNAVITMMSTDGVFNIYNANGTTHVLVDVAGIFVGGVEPAGSAPSLRTRSVKALT